MQLAIAICRWIFLTVVLLFCASLMAGGHKMNNFSLVAGYIVFFLTVPAAIITAILLVLEKHYGGRAPFQLAAPGLMFSGLVIAMHIISWGMTAFHRTLPGVLAGVLWAFAWYSTFLISRRLGNVQ